MFIGEGGCDAVSFFLCKKLGNRLFGAFLVHFFDIKKSHKSILQELVRPIWRRERDSNP